MDGENKEPKEYFERVGNDYWRVWDSLAKRDISNFELTLVGRILAEKPSLGRPLKVLEIGIGPGRVAKKILDFPVEYYGVDVSEKMLAVFKERFGSNPKVKELAVGDIGKETPFPKVKFDCIVAWRVLYYLENWPVVIEHLTTLLNPGGMMVISMLNSHSTAVLGKFFGGPLTGYYSNYSELQEFLKKNRFTEVKITGYARLPDVLYDWVNHPLSAKAVFLVENILRFFLGETFLARMFYVVARK